MVAANHITGMRTATASVIATKTVFKPLNDEPLILAIHGAGMQGTAHAEAFYHFFKLKEVSPFVLVDINLPLIFVSILYFNYFLQAPRIG